jgi:hypothetical protein
MIIATNITAKAHDNNEGTRPPLIDAEGVMRIDNTSLEHFCVCARAAQYYLVERREIRADKVALRFGGAWHIVMEILYRDHNGRPKDYQEFFEQCQEALLPYFEKYPPPPEDYRTWKFLSEHIMSYVGYANVFDDFEVITLAIGEPAIELYFEYDLGEVDFDGMWEGRHLEKVRVIWTGRIDAIIRREEKLWIMDHKTTAVIGPNFFSSFLNASAPMGYTWAAQRMLGEEVSGLYLNAIGVRRPTKTGVPFEVQRQMFTFEPERLEEWHYNTLTLVSDFLSHLDRGFFPMETVWCVNKFGPCKYLDVCSMPPAHRQAMLDSNSYEDVTWNPKEGTRQ